MTAKSPADEMWEENRRPGSSEISCLSFKTKLSRCDLRIGNSQSLSRISHLVSWRTGLQRPVPANSELRRRKSYGAAPWHRLCAIKIAGIGLPADRESGMDNYEGAFETAQPNRTEDSLTKTVEDFTAAVPSSAYLGVAVGAMALALALQLAGRGKWGNFIAQWVPACLIIGVYNKLVKLEGHDHADRPKNRGYTT